jgi:hypothetical protein
MSGIVAALALLLPLRFLQLLTNRKPEHLA